MGDIAQWRDDNQGVDVERSDSMIPEHNARTLQFMQDKHAQSRILAQVERNMHMALLD